jgi:hypothetical protein
MMKPKLGLVGMSIELFVIETDSLFSISNTIKNDLRFVIFPLLLAHKDLILVLQSLQFGRSR